MAHYILAGVACGGLLIAFVPRLRRTIRTRRVQADPLAFNMAACQFAHEVDHLIARRTKATGEWLHIHRDADGGVHYDMAPIDEHGVTRMRRSVAFFHRVPLTESTQPSVPAIPAVTASRIISRPYSGYSVRSGSFGRVPTLSDPINPYAYYSPRITRVLPTLNDEMEAL